MLMRKKKCLRLFLLSNILLFRYQIILILKIIASIMKKLPLIALSTGMYNVIYLVICGIFTSTIVLFMKCISKCALFNSFRCRICSVPIGLLWAFPLFHHPMSNDAPIATFSFSIFSFHRFLSLSKLSRHDSFANFSIWGPTSLSRAFSVDSPSDGTLI